MAYKYPNGTELVDGIITDIIATVAWIDFILQLKLAHMAFPISLNTEIGESPKASRDFKKFQEYSDGYVAKLSYRGKVDMFFALATFEDERLRKDLKMFMIELGKIRNVVAHNIAINLADSNLNLSDITVGAQIFNENYSLFNEIFERVKPLVQQLEESME